MKTILIPVLLAIALASCGYQATPEADGKNNNPQGSEINDSTAQNNPDETVQMNAETKPIKLSEDDFVTKVFDYRKGGNWKYKGDKPCMIDFYADWCGPCKVIAPYMEDFAKKYAGEIYIYKVNTDFAQELSAYFSINAIPAVMFCPMKGENKMVVGSNPKDEYEKLIQTLLLGKK